MTYKNIIYQTDAGIGTLTINRPKALNALNIDTLDEIVKAIRDMEDDSTVNVVIITGAGEKAFVAGADIPAMQKMSKSDAENFLHIGHDVMRVIEECEKPVIAMVNGFALGGGTEIALACDFIYASNNAKFALPEVGLGIFPGFGGTQRLPRYIGEQRAKEMIFSGKMITADEAYEWGMVNKVTIPEELLEETLKLAGEIQKKGQLAVRLAKKAINEGVYLKMSEGLKIEKDTFIKCFETKDREEGMAAFIDKRKPNFTGK